MESDRQIHNVMFRPDNLVEITYADDPEDSDVGLLRTIVFYPEHFHKEVAEVLDDLSTLIDEVEIHRRDPQGRAPKGAIPIANEMTGRSEDEFDAKEF